MELPLERYGIGFHTMTGHFTFSFKHLESQPVEQSDCEGRSSNPAHQWRPPAQASGIAGLWEHRNRHNIEKTLTTFLDLYTFRHKLCKL